MPGRTNAHSSSDDYRRCPVREGPGSVPGHERSSMPTGVRAFLIDTNVLVYAYDRADATKQARAIAVVDQLASRQRGALSAQVLSEFLVTVTRKLEPPLTLEKNK